MLTQSKYTLWELQNYKMSNHNDVSLIPFVVVCSFTWNLPSSSLNTSIKLIITQAQVSQVTFLHDRKQPSEEVLWVQDQYIQCTIPSL